MFFLNSNNQTSYATKLQLTFEDLLFGDVDIKAGDGEMGGLSGEMKLGGDGEHPIEEDAAHSGGDLGLLGEDGGGGGERERRGGDGGMDQEGLVFGRVQGGGLFGGGFLRGRRRGLGLEELADKFGEGRFFGFEELVGLFNFFLAAGLI